MKAQECLYFSLLPIMVLVETFIFEAKAFKAWPRYKQIIEKKKKGKHFNLPVEQDGIYLFLSLQNYPMPSKIVL